MSKSKRELRLDFTEDVVLIKQIAEALSSESRIKILEAIKQNPEANHRELAEISKMSESSITHHIRFLLDCGLLVEEVRKGMKGRLKKVPKVKINKIIMRL